MLITRTVYKATQPLRNMRSNTAPPSRVLEPDEDFALLGFQDLELGLGGLVEEADDVAEVVVFDVGDDRSRLGVELGGEFGFRLPADEHEGGGAGEAAAGAGGEGEWRGGDGVAVDHVAELGWEVEEGEGLRHRVEMSLCCMSTTYLVSMSVFDRTVCSSTYEDRCLC